MRDQGPTKEREEILIIEDKETGEIQIGLKKGRFIFAREPIDSGTAARLARMLDLGRYGHAVRFKHGSICSDLEPKGAVRLATELASYAKRSASADGNVPPLSAEHFPGLETLRTLFSDAWLAGDQRAARKVAAVAPTTSMYPLAERKHPIGASINKLSTMRPFLPPGQNISQDSTAFMLFGFSNDLHRFCGQSLALDAIVTRIRADPREYAKHATELAVASAFAQAGYEVRLVPTTVAPSFDLEATLDLAAFEIECKAQDLHTKADFALMDGVETMLRRIVEMARRLPGGLSCDIALARGLEAGDVDEIASTVQRVIWMREDGYHVASTSQAEIIIRHLPAKSKLNFPVAADTPVSDEERLYRQAMIPVMRFFRVDPRHLGFSEMPIAFKRLSPLVARASIQRPLLVTLRNIPAGDRTTCVTEYMRQASRQFSGRKTAILYAQLFRRAPWLGDDFARAENLIRRSLFQYSKISGVALFQDAAQVSEASLVPTVTLIRNHNAARPLPDDLELPAPCYSRDLLARANSAHVAG